MSKKIGYICMAMLLTMSTSALAEDATDNSGDHLIINELMQSNIDCWMDDLNDFPDSWVELYNPSN